MPFRPLERGFVTTGEYERGYQDGYDDAMKESYSRRMGVKRKQTMTRPKRKVIKRKKSKWQIFMGQKKNQIKLRNGKLNLKKMGVAYRKKNKK